jgi:predicted ATPase
MTATRSPVCNAHVAGSVRTNLRAATSSFIGRESELEQLAALFDDARLVTLLGPGGIGKTRLAIRHAEARLSSLGRAGRGGVWLVDLSGASTLVEALATVAATLGIALHGRATERDMFESLGRDIGNLGPTLIVLDNVEQLGASWAGVVEVWQALAPSARWLVTSRAALRLTAEHVVALGPLALDDARALFVERASCVRALGASESEPSAVRDIVEAIDRMPLAIELAASRMRVLSGEELRRRLASPLEVLAGGTHERHASVRRVVLDSVALLPPEMRNGFSVDAAEAVLGAADLSRSDVLESLDTLVRSSLLRVAHEAGGPARYGLFETIRDVARDLATDEPARSAVVAAHASHYAALAARSRREDPAAAVALEAELENVLAAAATSSALARAARSPARARDAAEIALAIEPILARRGQSALRERLFSEVLESLGPDDTSRASIAEVLLGRGLARRELGNGDAARSDFEAALAATEGADPGLRALALVRLGDVHDLHGDTARARDRLDTSLALLASTRRGPTRSAREAEALLRLGHAHRREGSLDPARAAILGAIRRYRALRRDDGLASALYELGVVEMFRGQADAAFAHLDDGLSVARRGAMPIMEGACLTARGCLLQDAGRLDEALDHHARAAAIFRDCGSALREASALHYLATTYLERGDPSETISLLEQTRAQIESMGAPRYEAITSGALAIALAEQGRPAEAALELDVATEALAQVPDEPALATVLTIHRATVAACGGRVDAPPTTEAARRLVDASPTDDSRFALRMLERKRAPAVVKAPAVLRVWGAAEAFTPPGGARVVLPAGSPLRRILAHLVAQREAVPGEPIVIDEIVRVGWPDEKIGADAALNRAYVALATLRRRGLRDAIVSGGGGYALSRAVRVERIERGPV